MSAKLQRGEIRRLRDGGWRAKNQSGAEWSFWPNDYEQRTAEERAHAFSASVCVYHKGGGARYLYPEKNEPAYSIALAQTRAGGRPMLHNITTYFA